MLLETEMRLEIDSGGGGCSGCPAPVRRPDWNIAPFYTTAPLPTFPFPHSYFSSSICWRPFGRQQMLRLALVLFNSLPTHYSISLTTQYIPLKTRRGSWCHHRTQQLHAPAAHPPRSRHPHAWRSMRCDNHVLAGRRDNVHAG